MGEINNLPLIQQGAEGRIYKTVYLGKDTIVKERFVKKYRHPDLDQHILKERIKAEARGLLKSKIAGVLTPTIYLVDIESRKLYIEFVQGTTCKNFINELLPQEGIIPGSKLYEVSKIIGQSVGKLHTDNIIHGDLTTSNIIIKEKCENNKLDVYFIDFGLSFISTSAEDKGVDLYVLERALLTTHASSGILFNIILDSYTSQNKSISKEVLKKYEEVKARGRKRTMVG